MAWREGSPILYSIVSFRIAAAPLSSFNVSIKPRAPPRRDPGGGQATPGSRARRGSKLYCIKLSVGLAGGTGGILRLTYYRHERVRRRHEEGPVRGHLAAQVAREGVAHVGQHHLRGGRVAQLRKRRNRRVLYENVSFGVSGVSQYFRTYIDVDALEREDLGLRLVALLGRVAEELALAAVVLDGVQAGVLHVVVADEPRLLPALHRRRVDAEHHIPEAMPACNLKK